MLAKVTVVGPSAAFSAFIAHFPSFNVTHGPFAGAIILLVWLWLTNVALLFGAELNAEIERRKGSRVDLRTYGPRTFRPALTWG